MTTANPSPAFVVHKRRKVTLSRISGKAGWVLAQVFLWVFLATVVFPMLWTFMTSFKTSRDLF